MELRIDGERRSIPLASEDILLECSYFEGLLGSVQSSETIVPVPSVVDYDALQNLIRYCELTASSNITSSTAPLAYSSVEDEQFIEELSMEQVGALSRACVFLGHDRLHEVCCKRIAIEAVKQNPKQLKDLFL